MSSPMMLAPTDWLMILVGGTALWGFVWLGRSLVDQQFKLVGEKPKGQRSYVMHLLQLAASIVVVGALVAIHQAQRPANVAQAVAIGTLAALFAIGGFRSKGPGNRRHSLARGVWAPLGIILVSVTVFLLERSR